MSNNFILVFWPRLHKVLLVSAIAEQDGMEADYGNWLQLATEKKEKKVLLTWTRVSLQSCLPLLLFLSLSFSFSS